MGLKITVLHKSHLTVLEKLYRELQLKNAHTKGSGLTLKAAVDIIQNIISEEAAKDVERLKGTMAVGKNDPEPGDQPEPPKEEPTAAEE
jgi:hypothetical protein